MTTSLWQRWLGGARRLWQRSDWVDFAGADWPERIMDQTVTDRFHAKQGRSTGRWIIEADGRRLGVYLKRHYRLPWWQGVLSVLWPDGDWSPGMRERRNLEWAAAQGLPVPAAVAAGEFLGPWGRLQSFLAVEELTDMLPLHEALPLAARTLSAAEFREWKSGLVVELARLTRALHDRKHFHKDWYLCHFYVRREDISRDLAKPASGQSWRDRVHVIDLHRLAHHPWTWRRWQLKDLAQLLYSSEVEGVTAQDRLHFWRLYCGAAWKTPGERWLRRLVRAKWQRYRRHNQAA
ncbi:MAG: lipopolysaccharide kinase [Planctomycetia bacterium]|nr:lipopolysaccharide kinase [Planctomycetia bacterium]